MNKGLLTSKTDEWETPQWLFDKLNAQFNFKFDVCANQNNAKCKTYFDKETDGLSQEWTGACWMNPPYGRQIGKWIKKAYESSLGGQRLYACCPQEQIQAGGMTTA